MENRVLVIQKAGEHLANREYRESLSIKRAFDKLGVHCMVWGKGYPTFKIPFEQMMVGYNIIIVLENYDFDWIPKFDKFKGIVVFWSIDGHLILDKHKEFVRGNKIDLILNSNIDCVGSWDGFNQESLWFPNAFDEDLIKPIPTQKKIHRIGFCGSKHASREEVMDKVDLKLKEINHSIKRDIFVIGDEMVKAINSYLIHFNYNIKGDINYRTFETLGCQTALMTNYTNGLEKLFDLEKEMVVYQDEEDMIMKAYESVTDIAKTVSISRNGHLRVLSDHTYTVRMKHLLQAISS